jgi:hypothetical protein
VCANNGSCDQVADSPGDLFAGSVLDIAGEQREGRDYVTPDPEGCGRPKGVVDCDSGLRSAIYYRVTREAGRTAIDYWWFLRFNDFPRADLIKCRRFVIVGVIACDDHEGDWEGVRVVLTPGGQGLDVRFDAHGRSERYTALPVQHRGSRPIVYIAEGTHSAYPRPCDGRYCAETGARLPDGGFDGKRSWGRNSTLACAGDCLVPLPRSGWPDWPGRWGRSCNRSGCVRSEGPRSPRRQHHRSVPCFTRRTDFNAISSTQAARMASAYRSHPVSRCRRVP